MLVVQAYIFRKKVQRYMKNYSNKIFIIYYFPPLKVGRFTQVPKRK